MHITTKLTLLTLAVSFLCFTGCSKSNPEKEKDEGMPPPTLQAPKSDIFSSQRYMGINYGPYHYNNEAPGTAIPLSRIKEDMKMIAKNFHFIRTYTVADGMDKVVAEAAANDIEVALGVHCYPNNANKTKADIDLAVKAAKAHIKTVQAIVVGNETNLIVGEYVPDNQVAQYMDYARKQMNSAGLKNTTVTSCITGVGGLANGMGDSRGCPQIMKKCKDLNGDGRRTIFMTIYPYWGQKTNNQNSPGNIAGNMEWSYNNGMQQAENMGLSVVIGEIGWPSGGDNANLENVANQAINFKTTLEWVKGNNIYRKAFNTLWFSMFDEPWKHAEPNGVGPHWGIYGPNGAKTPKFPIPAM
ncbi:hypothetical protein DJ568_03640 [Mucilaginibacter hurinus]|uniref:Endo-1,3-beta-glucanase btgC n=1 Tax=Mucilaginibacter hurinus TaxID=2201324 RepID=A0A367GS01_9SPHI|nr:glycosyl hydrolase family 17 protein [Mucilaginibacter hurinus]RCH55858.1 hypothetical protein DJ568_03640 [Mucilaginibacter hurinus]